MSVPSLEGNLHRINLLGLDTAVLNRTFNRLCEGATATAAIFSGRQSRSPSVRRDELLAVNCFVVPPRKDGGAEVAIKTKTLLSNAANPNRKFLRAV